MYFEIFTHHKEGRKWFWKAFYTTEEHSSIQFISSLQADILNPDKSLYRYSVTHEQSELNREQLTKFWQHILDRQYKNCEPTECYIDTDCVAKIKTDD